MSTACCPVKPAPHVPDCGCELCLRLKQGVRHGHDHDHAGHAPGEGDEEADPKREAGLLIFCAVLFTALMIGESRIAGASGPWAVRVLFAVPYLICGWSVFRAAGSLARRGDVLNEFTLMAGATLVAIGLDKPAEAAGVMLFYRIGEFFQELATEKSRKSIKNLLASKPTTANVLRDGSVTTMPVESVAPGALVVVRAGENIPLDGTVVSGVSQVDQSPLTGESVPVSVAEGSAVYGGAINMSGVLTVSVTTAFADTHMARVLEMVENAASHKAPTERFMTRFARYYTPAVVVLAMLAAVLPPLFGLGDWKTWIYRALVMLVISCPCALVISIPLSYFGGIGAASRKGILVKGGTVLDGLTHIDTVVFDKTGTLTRGVFDVTSLAPRPGITEDELLHAAALAECESNHPVARSVMRRTGADFTRPGDILAQELPGRGMLATSGGRRYAAGNAALMAEQGLAAPDVSFPGTVVHVARDGAYLGHITVADVMKAESRDAVAVLKARGLQVIMLSGDREDAVAWAARETGIERHVSGLLPEGKVQALNDLAARDRAAFVGDGINDAPILALSRVGIAMGGMGAEAAVEAADAVILNDSPARVADLFALGYKIRSIVWQNVGMALGIKCLFMALGLVGVSGLWEAVFADVGVALLAVVNAARATRN